MVCVEMRGRGPLFQTHTHANKKRTPGHHPQVKTVASLWHDRLSTILDDFPRVDDVHPFYADLLNVLYDRDHYKLALGQLATARTLIDRVGSDYVRLLKYGDSLYRCKELKRAALGRMCTIMKRQGASLSYLEQVRQHMARLPSIDPAARTLLVCGYPNVGKSSFVNSVSRADVDVQPYAFTTKSLFVGHSDHRYLRWQIVDTPGILDRPLDERNTIEMQAVTALAHLRAAVLFVVDASGQCGYTLSQQAALFDSIKPLFAGKPLMVVVNKTDVAPVEGLPKEDRELLDVMAAEAARVSAGAAPGVAPDPSAPPPTLLTMSTLADIGVADVKAAACDALLAARVEAKLAGRRVERVAARLHVATPSPRGPPRPPIIPASVLAARAAEEAAGGASKRPPRRTERDAQEEAGGAGAYSADLTKHYALANSEWRRDVVPEIWDGKNIADYVDPDVESRLAALEAEEDAALATYEAEVAAAAAVAPPPLSPDEAETLAEIRARRKARVAEHRREKAAAGNTPRLPRTADAARGRTTGSMAASLARTGLDAGAAVARARAPRRSRARGASARAPSPAPRRGPAWMWTPTAPPPNASNPPSLGPCRAGGRRRWLCRARGAGCATWRRRTKPCARPTRRSGGRASRPRRGKATATFLTSCPSTCFRGSAGKGRRIGGERRKEESVFRVLFSPGVLFLIQVHVFFRWFVVC